MSKEPSKMDEEIIQLKNQNTRLTSENSHQNELIKERDQELKVLRDNN
jgi:hypothetical protein